MERGWGPQGERNTIHHKEFVTISSLRPGLEYGREKPLRDVRGGPGNIHILCHTFSKSPWDLATRLRLTERIWSNISRVARTVARRRTQRYN